MTAKKPEMYECIDGFVTADYINVAVGDLVEAGHPILKNRDWAFKPFAGARFKVTHAAAAPVKRDAPVEQATAAPGEKRDAKPAHVAEKTKRY